jgi:hypothetical protein
VQRLSVLKDAGMSHTDDCQERAEKCRTLAASALTAQQRTQWLGMAQFWSRQAKVAPTETPQPQPTMSELVSQICSQFVGKR